MVVVVEQRRWAILSLERLISPENRNKKTHMHFNFKMLVYKPDPYPTSHISPISHFLFSNSTSSVFSVQLYSCNVDRNAVAKKYRFPNCPHKVWQHEFLVDEFGLFFVTFVTIMEFHCLLQSGWLSLCAVCHRLHQWLFTSDFSSGPMLAGICSVFPLAFQALGLVGRTQCWTERSLMRNAYCLHKWHEVYWAILFYFILFFPGGTIAINFHIQFGLHDNIKFLQWLLILSQ